MTIRLWFVAALAIAVLPGAQASTITVTSLADPGDANTCTLRQAITAANTNTSVGTCTAGSAFPTVDLINIVRSVTFCKLNSCMVVLTSPLPGITEDVTINGSTNVTISGDTKYRVFDVQGVNVTISNLRILNGNAISAGAGGNGGAINTSSAGATLMLTNDTFSGNHAPNRAGALYVPSGTVVVTSCTFDNNSVGSYGGAIDQVGGLLILSNSTISNNTAAAGGGLEIESSSETRITNVTFSGNSATDDGGAIARIG